MAHAQSAAQPIEEPRRLGKGQLARQQVQEVVVQKRQGLTGVFEAAQRVLLGLTDVCQEAADVAGA
jgi:hypothetical protein